MSLDLELKINSKEQKKKHSNNIKKLLVWKLEIQLSGRTINIAEGSSWIPSTPHTPKEKTRKQEKRRKKQGKTEGSRTKERERKKKDSSMILRL